MNVATLSIDQAIIHEITDRSLAPPAPPELILSNALSPLDADLRGYFQARIAESLAKAAYPVIADPDRSSPAPDLVFNHLHDRTTNLVDTSQAMATHLFDAQQRVRSSPGLLVVSTGTLDTGPCLAILKLQKQEGLNLERVGDAGAETYSLEHLRRLMLTNDTRVFKVALFDSMDVHTVDDVSGLVSDKQRFSSPEKRMADGSTWLPSVLSTTWSPIQRDKRAITAPCSLSSPAKLTRFTRKHSLSNTWIKPRDKAS